MSIEKTPENFQTILIASLKSCYHNQTDETVFNLIYQVSSYLKFLEKNGDFQEPYGADEITFLFQDLMQNQPQLDEFTSEDFTEGLMIHAKELIFDLRQMIRLQEDEKSFIGLMGYICSQENLSPCMQSQLCNLIKDCKSNISQHRLDPDFFARVHKQIAFLDPNLTHFLIVLTSLSEENGAQVYQNWHTKILTTCEGFFQDLKSDLSQSQCAKQIHILRENLKLTQTLLSILVKDIAPKKIAHAFHSKFEEFENFYQENLNFRTSDFLQKIRNTFSEILSWLKRDSSEPRHLDAFFKSTEMIEQEMDDFSYSCEESQKEFSYA